MALRRLVRRADLVAAQRRDPHAARRPGAVRAGITGSGDSLLVLTWTADELARERAAGVRLLRAAGVTAGMRVANTLPGALATPGSLQLGDVVDELGALDVPLGAIESDAAAKQAWELIDRVEPQILILDPAGAVRLLSAAPPRARPWWGGIVWSTGLATQRPVSLPSECGFAGWQRRWLAVPEVSSFVAMSCALGSFHCDPDLSVDIIDADSGAPLPFGSTGLLALSHTGIAGEYSSGIRARLLAQPCGCGKPGVIVEIA